MRIYLKTSRNTEKIPFNYQSFLTGSLHKWIGKNSLHDDISLYSFSWFSGEKLINKGLFFPEGAKFFISTPDHELIKKIIEGIKKTPDMAFGMKVQEIIMQPDPEFGNSRIFHPASPILVKRIKDNNTIHYTYENKESNNYLTETLKNKLKKAGKDNENIKVEFSDDYRNKKIKTIYYNKIGNKVNMSAVKITGTPEQLAFAWNVGVGNSTGIGFGALK